ncbi:MAG TPA: tail fiber domain-containing protein [Kofleriaceae bacterium]|nr:tail fiber domain-containing protein [Kofleriaceae bacterium]
MTHRRLRLVLGLGLALAAPAAAQAQGTPGTISFKARLGDNGTPVTGAHDFRFRIYDAPTAGEMLWEEPETSLDVSAGVVVHELGAGTALTPAFAGGAKVYLEIRMDGTLMEPRVAIASVPYALRSRDSTTLGGNAASAFATAGHNHNATYINADGDTMTGPLRLDAGFTFYGKKALQGNDTWLRLNQEGDFTSGVYTPGVMRSDGGVTGNNIAIGHAPFGAAGFPYETLQLPGNRNLRIAFGDTTAGQEDVVITADAQILMQSRVGDCMNGWFCNIHAWDMSIASMLYSGLSQRSDRRLKKNIQSIGGGLETLMRLRPVTFEWKDARQKGTRYGFIAQEVEEVIPALVSEATGGIKTLETQGILPVAVDAIKELKAENDELRGMIERQQRQIDALAAGRPLPAPDGEGSSVRRVGVGVGAGLGAVLVLILGVGLVRRRRDD